MQFRPIATITPRPRRPLLRYTPRAIRMTAPIALSYRDGRWSAVARCRIATPAIQAGAVYAAPGRTRAAARQALHRLLRRQERQYRALRPVAWPTTIAYPEPMNALAPASFLPAIDLSAIPPDR